MEEARLELDDMKTTYLEFCRTHHKNHKDHKAYKADITKLEKDHKSKVHVNNKIKFQLANALEHDLYMYFSRSSCLIYLISRKYKNHHYCFASTFMNLSIYLNI